jgi:hypothetical protein
MMQPGCRLEWKADLVAGGDESYDRFG